MSKLGSDNHVIAELRRLFDRNGYVRPPRARRLPDVPGRFRRGFEFRLTADSRSELQRIRRMLRQTGFKPGRPFVKGNQMRQPVYGREALMRFLALIGCKDA